ncbi:NUDIX hydrolase [Streptomyces sp. NPDC001633]|uniref:NUDIX hydrolase n=1 Tax=Streptomyces sp. NPDC001633 TaxID=3364595 RepID=UPI0036B629CA
MANRYVYTVLYNAANGDFLLANKNVRGYFFAPSSVYPDGRLLNGGGKPALPGGALTTGESVKDGAVREFREETGLHISAYYTEAQSWQNGLYNAGYFRVTAQQLTSLRTSVETALSQGHLAARDIYDRRITRYPEIHQRYPQAAPDHELNTVEIWNVNTRWSTIQEWSNDQDLSWFVNILRHIKSPMS